MRQGWVLIQNAIMLWNYLYLSQLLTNNANTTERLKTVEAINKGSVISWQHINLQGEYDFTKHNNNDIRFDMNKILQFRLTFKRVSFEPLMQLEPNVHELINLGARKKEAIEDSINTEKNRGYHYKHLFSHNRF